MAKIESAVRLKAISNSMQRITNINYKFNIKWTILMKSPYKNVRSCKVLYAVGHQCYSTPRVKIRKVMHSPRCKLAERLKGWIVTSLTPETPTSIYAYPLLKYTENMGQESIRVFIDVIKDRVEIFDFTAWKLNISKVVVRNKCSHIKDDTRILNKQT